MFNFISFNFLVYLIVYDDVHLYLVILTLGFSFLTILQTL